MNEITGYNLSRMWFDFCFENPDKIRPIHTAIYFFAIEHCNRLGWKKKFGFPSQMAMEALGIKNWRTYIKAFNELVEWGFFEMVEKSKNQYSSNIIAIVKNTRADTKALDKALQKHSQKQSRSIVSIYKQRNKELITNKPLNIEFDIFWEAYGKKVDRVKSEGKWNKLTDKEREQAMEHVPAYVESTDDVKYRKNPTTYLNNKCWLDEELPSNGQPKFRAPNQKFV
jgi:hypothetical protein